MNIRSRWVRYGAVLVLGAATLVVGARPVARAWERWERARWHAKVQAAFAQLASGSDAIPALPPMGQERPGEPERDDATIRRLLLRAYYGTPTADVSAQILTAAQREAQRWPSLMRSRAPLPQATVSGESWVNLGPTDARIQSNQGVYQAVDSGRGAAVRVDPRNRDVVYFATAFGGVWKTYDFTSAQPTWHPITDTVGSLATGAFELDPSNPDTLYLGLGDALDFYQAGGAVFKSTDGGGTWTMLTARLSGTYPASAGGRAESAVTIRDLVVDRADANKILVTTDVGLFRSTDGGAHFSLVPLPDKMGTLTLEQATWTITYVGATGGQSVWLVSGVDACATNMLPPGVGAGQPAGTACAGGNLGDVWRSSDSGATWTSLRATGKLPTAAMTGNAEYGRMALAAGATTNPDATVVWAQVANDDEGNSAQLAIWKSTDGGKTFAVNTLANVAVTNPTTVTGECTDMNVGHDQSWYNLAIAVDPTDANHVLVGGNLCGVRTIDGGATWSNVSHWLPTEDPSITLPYVHADWHTLAVSNVGGTVMAFTGSDGGIFSSSDVFSAATGDAATWNYTNNRGIATHLFYGVSSGDPTAGDAEVAFGGLQDNGTRFRDLDPTLGKPTTFNQIIGADGFGTALVRGPAGVGTVFWASIYSQRFLCTDTAVNCSTKDFPTLWQQSPVNVASTSDPDPFTMRYAVVEGDATGAFITPTTYHIYKFSYNGTTLTAKKITPTTPVGTPGPFGTTGNPVTVRNVFASPFQHTNCTGGAACRLYGAALTGGHIAVGTDIAGTVTWSKAAALLGTSATKDTTMGSTTAVAFPSSAAHFAAGALDGKVYLATSTAGRMFDELTVVPDSIGRIFLTTDGGTTYKPFHGNGTSDLPNVPIQAVVFDPSDTTDSTIFVGNDLGVYQTTDMGATWHRYGVGLPMVRVTEIRIAKNSGLMRIGTFGRGIWEIYPNAMAAGGVRGDGDWDRNLAIDFLDLGAMASRLGDTPATTAQPYYDWHLDITGSANSIAEDDLTALVAKFGSNP